MLSPIIVFAFNRLESLKSTIESLKNNPESKDSDLIIFVDGYRENKEGEKEKVLAVRDFVKKISGFKTVSYYFSVKNKGLAPSIIQGVSVVMNKYGKAIIIEDDLYVSNSFLRFMNKMLNDYENDVRIFQISGYAPKLSKNTLTNSDIFLNGRAQCWSWATWKNRWESVDWEVKDYELLNRNKHLQRSFNSHGSDLFGMLKSAMNEKISSWFVRYCYEMHKQGKYCICPKLSLVRNDGFSSDATHCKNYNRYKIEFEKEHIGEFLIPSELKPNKHIQKEATKYWTIRYRIYGKLMTYLHKYVHSN